MLFDNTQSEKKKLFSFQMYLSGNHPTCHNVLSASEAFSPAAFEETSIQAQLSTERIKRETTETLLTEEEPETDRGTSRPVG